MSNNISQNRLDELTKLALNFYDYKKNYKKNMTPSNQKEIIMKLFNATSYDWNDWHWQLKNRINSPEQLKQIFNLSEDETEKIRKVNSKYRFSVTPYYLSLIRIFNDTDPIYLQSIPQDKELLAIGELDPTNENGTNPVGVIIRRYPDRVILNLTNCCATFCRHCQRRRNIGKIDKCASKQDIKDSIEYIKKHPEIRDVLITGGDPLTLEDEFIDQILNQIRNIKTVEIIRIGTRMPVTLPQRITVNLINILKKYSPIFVNTQFNHPNEITSESIAACETLSKNGIILGNQMVFLKGINDDYYTLQLLNQFLLKSYVRPYYIFHPKNVIGTHHFSISIEKGLEIYEKLRGNTSGLAIPTYVYSASNGLGKISLSSDVLKNVDSNNNYILKTWENKEIKVKREHEKRNEI